MEQRIPVKSFYSSISDFDTYLNKTTKHQHYLLFSKDEQLLGWAFIFEREKEQWFALIINGNFHSKGYGTILLNRLKQTSKKLNAWVMDRGNELKLNGQIYAPPMPFYLKNDFTLIAGTRIETEKISAVKMVWSK